MSHEGYHEPIERLSAATTDMHRALLSLMEELEAVDWYAQRAEVCADDALRAVLVHNQNEEIEHAMMTLEWIRRTSPMVDAHARRYLFTTAPITAAEAASSAQAPAADATLSPTAAAPGRGLGIGSLKGTPWTS